MHGQPNYDSRPSAGTAQTHPHAGQRTAYGLFSALLRETALLLAYEVTRDLPLETKRVETPIEVMDAPVPAGKKLCFVSVCVR
ncbi:MAG: hypothetical protein Ct9H300mP14_04650 [Gammaproteobacteria bacterium]|nr:MAG: hypothetical protein Ct9H300mP14_04650 [Gammaproteobacteria bacterium]